MIKSITLIKRKPGLSQEEFIKHYEEVHVPLSLKHFPTFKRYVRNYVIVPPGAEEPGFDCIMEIWFDDMEGAKAVSDALGGYSALGGYETELGLIFREDEEKFMDRGSRIAFFVDERVSK
jgi:uncharacterized protein (TIGR02118 family)